MQTGMGSGGGFSLNVFSQDELRAVHWATLEVLEKTGLMVEDEEARAIFDGGGARVDPERHIVRFPAYLVEEAIKSAPSQVFVAGRHPKNDLLVGGTRICFANFGEGVNVVDLETGEHRPSTKEDLARAALIADYLEHIDVCQRAVGSRDKPEEALTIHNAEAIINNSSKPYFIGPGGRRQLKWIVEIAAAAAGGLDKLQARPFLCFNTCPTSPLRLAPSFCHTVIDGVRLGLPVNIVSMAMAGATAPVTLAGAVTIQNAEVLGGIVLSQLVRKGAPIIYGSTTTIMDLKLGTSPMGCPEIGMVSAAAAKLAQHYQLPSWVAGGWGDTKLADAQAGHEKTLNLMQAALAGANITYGLGAIETGLTLDYAQLVMDNEFAGLVKLVVKGIPVNDDTLALDIIHEIGHLGNYISHNHTHLYMKAVQSQPKLIDRRRWENWKGLGGTDLAHRAREQAKNILKTHQPDPLPDGVAETIRQIVQAAEEDLIADRGLKNG